MKESHFHWLFNSNSTNYIDFTRSKPITRMLHSKTNPIREHVHSTNQMLEMKLEEDFKFVKVWIVLFFIFEFEIVFQFAFGSVFNYSLFWFFPQISNGLH